MNASDAGDRWYKKVKEWLKPSAGKTAISVGGLQLAYALYFSTLAFALMQAASAREGGVGGTGWWLLPVMFGVAFLTSLFVSKWGDSTPRKVVAAALIVVFFWGLIIGGIESSAFAFGFREKGPVRPINLATALYSVTAGTVFLRLQRRISPREIHGQLPKDKTQIHFDNSWRLFQAMISVTVAVVVGVVFPVGALVVQRQDVILQPLAWYIGGLLSSFLVLGLQLWYEMKFLERAYGI